VVELLSFRLVLFHKEVNQNALTEEIRGRLVTFLWNLRTLPITKNLESSWCKHRSIRINERVTL
jgi:hypothetical protein